MDETKALRRRVVLKGLSAGFIYYSFWSCSLLILLMVDPPTASKLAPLSDYLFPFLAEIAVVAVLDRKGLGKWAWSLLISALLWEIFLIPSITLLATRYYGLATWHSLYGTMQRSTFVLIEVQLDVLAQLFWTTIFVFVLKRIKYSDAPS